MVTMFEDKKRQIQGRQEEAVWGVRPYAIWAPHCWLSRCARGPSSRPICCDVFSQPAEHVEEKKRAACVGDGQDMATWTIGALIGACPTPTTSQLVHASRLRFRHVRRVGGVARSGRKWQPRRASRLVRAASHATPINLAFAFIYPRPESESETGAEGGRLERCRCRAFAQRTRLGPPR